MRTSHLALATLALPLLIAVHAAQEGGVSGTLTDCTVAENSGEVHETCTLESADPILAGTWSFIYEIEENEEGIVGFDDEEGLVTYEYDPDEVVLQFGEITIVGGEGQWDGMGERFVAVSGTLDDIWAEAFIDESVRGAVGDGGAWVIGGLVRGEGEYSGFELQLGGAGDQPGPPYALNGWIQEGETDVDDSQLLQWLITGVIALIALAVLATPAVISALKGRWWMGVLGLVAVVGWLFVLFTFTEDPSEEFQETAVFRILELLLQLALPGGLLLLVLGAALKPRPGSWWDRNRAAKPAFPQQAATRATRTEQIMADNPALSWKKAWRQAGKET